MVVYRDAEVADLTLTLQLLDGLQPASFPDPLVLPPWTRPSPRRRSPRSGTMLGSLLKNSPTPARYPRFGSKIAHLMALKPIQVLISVPE